MTFFRSRLVYERRIYSRQLCSRQFCSRQKKLLAIFLFVSCVFLVGGFLQNTTAQIIVGPNADATAPVILNDYYKQIPEIPAEPVLGVSWYSKPKDIAQRFDLYGINPDTRYFEDDTPYLEKTIDGIKGRLFLKEVSGYRYQILDMQFVPYFDAIVPKEESEEEKRDEANNTDVVPSVAVDPSNAGSNIGNTNGLEESRASASKDTVQSKAAELQFVNPVAGAAVNKHASTPTAEAPEEDTADEEEGKNSIIPLYTNRAEGYSIIIDVGLKKSGVDVKRNVLYRFDGNANKLYEERYVYTNRGAIQRLSRTYANGAVQRFVYYFSTGGLKEIFYQDPDGSTYLLAYTLAGALSTKRLYNEDAELVLDLANTYNENNSLVHKAEIDYLTYTVVESDYEDEKITTRKIYSFLKLADGKGNEVSKDKNAEQDVAGSTDTGAVEQTAAPNSENARDNAEQSGNTPNTKTLTLPTAITLNEYRDFMPLLRTDNYKYNPSGNQVASKSVNLLHEDVSSVQYEDEIKTESFFRNNILIKEVISDGDDRIEVFFFQQEPIFKLYFRRNKKLKEEILVQGEVVETRIIE